MVKKQKSQAGRAHNQNPFESLGSILQGAGDSLVKDLANPSVNEFWEQMLGAESKKNNKQSGELHEGQELNLKKPQAESGEIATDYVREIIHPEKANNRENREIQIRVQEIMIEIKKLTDSSAELAMQFKDVKAETPAGQIGTYHEHFLEWVFATIRAARMRIEESAGWLSAMHSKKDRKYWAMFKKHGTSFGLSNERNVSTQVG